MNALVITEQIIACRAEQAALRRLGRTSSLRLLEALALQIQILEALL